MPLRRTAQASRHWFAMPPAIQNGNSFNNFFTARTSSCLLAFLFAVFAAFPSWAREGTLQNVKLSPDSNTAGVAAIYSLTFQPQTTLPNTGKIVIFFPDGFDISGVTLASNDKNIDGGYESVDVDLDGGNRVVTLTRDGTGSPVPGGFTVNATVKLAIVRNPIAAKSYVFSLILTQDANGITLDRGENIPDNVTIKPGPLHHFVFSSPAGIGNQTAGKNFDFTLFAKDAFNNNVTVNDSIIFSGNNGTLTPKSVKMSNVASLTVSAKITKAQNGVLITATTQTPPGQNGTSNSFNVVPDQLATFALSPVASSLVAGAPFTLNITAQDAVGNTITSFAGPVHFNPASEINPATTGNFVNGVRSETVAYLKSGNKQITVSQNPGGAGVTGTSNNFTVTPGKPSGVIAFTPTLKAIPADRSTTTTINSSGPVVDAQNNNVGGGKLFTVSVNDTALGTITTIDADQTIPGNQIATNSAGGSLGRLSFVFKAGGKGGTATIFISSVDGTAAGSVSISVNQVRILSVTTAPLTVSQGQRHIAVQMRVQNSGADTVSLDEANLSFANLSSNYSVTKPSPLPKIPGNDAIRTLTFSVNVAPDAQTGSVPVDGQIAGKLSSGRLFSDTGADTADAWTVQTPAKLSVTLQTSQKTVTQGQVQPWQITMQVKNEGESEAQAVFDNPPVPEDITRTSLTGGYVVTPVRTNVVIGGNKSTDIYFEVTPTGGALPNSTFDGQVFARELNSDSVHFAANSAQLFVQPRDSVSIASVALDSVFNRNAEAGTVNVGQSFKIKVGVRSNVANAEKVDSVRVRLNKTNSNDIIAGDLLTLNGANGFLAFEVKAGPVAGTTSQFSAQVVEAYSANTHAWTVKTSTVLRSVSVDKQAPAQLRVDPPATSINKVQFGTTQKPWTIQCVVANIVAVNNGAAMVIDSSKVTVKIDSELQNDYKISNVNTLATLSAGQSDTLKYKVETTGYTGGEATLTVTVYGHDKNSNLPLTKSNSTTFTVATSALVKILQTDFSANVNRVAGSEIGLVNTGQKFKIEVTVENTGLEVIDSAYVSLKSGDSAINPALAAATTIGTNGDTAKAIFEVTAASSVNMSGEKFTAQLKRVVTTKGVVLTTHGANGDTTAVARIESPARLQLSLVTADGATAYSFNQEFKIRARIKNLGQAQFDNSGKLMLTLPLEKSYRLAGNDSLQKKIAAGDSVEWKIITPSASAESLNDTFRVELKTPPLDKNSGNPAQAANSTAKIAISTLSNTLRVVQKAIVAPEGAADGTLSAGQIFALHVRISASSNLTNKTVMLEIPSGSGFRLVNNDAAMKNAPDDTVRWQLQAPNTENLKSVALRFHLGAFSGNNPVSNLDSLVIQRTEKQAILQLEPSIKNPAAQNGVVAVNQVFTMAVKVRNTGRALAIDTAKVKLILPASWPQSAPGEKKAAFDAQNQIRELTWDITAPSTAKSRDTIRLAITQRPHDNNSGNEVLTSNDPAEFYITVENKGTLAANLPTITDPAGAIDGTVSSGQEFTVSDSLRWSNAANLVATLQLPANFTTPNAVQSLPNLPANGTTKVSWVVRAPGGPINKADFRVSLAADDVHDTTVKLNSESAALSIAVVNRARVSLNAQITDPPSAMDGVLSINQPFTVQATLANSGAAKLSGLARVYLMRPAGADYTLVNPKQDTLTIDLSNSQSCSWRLQAPGELRAVSDLLTLQLVQPPLDENTGAAAAVTDGEASLAVSTEGRKLIVTSADKGGGPAAQGQKNLMLMRLLLSNPAGNGAGGLNLQTLRFDLRKGAGVSSVEPSAVFQNVWVFNRGRRVGKVENILPGLATLQIALNEDSVNIATATPDTLSIFADLTANAAGTFRLSFDHSNDFNAIDLDGGGGVAIESADGKQGTQFLLESNAIALHGATDEESFFNYPNPFPPGKNLINGEGTRFSIPAGASGELKIVTLLGELVWETKIDARNAAVFWDGHNGAGQRVLNGVYVAILKTSNGKMLTTKVAVLKK